MAWKSEHPASLAEATGGDVFAKPSYSPPSPPLPVGPARDGRPPAQGVRKGADNGSSWQVNHSPSFTTDSRLDREVKDALLLDAMILANLRGCDKRKVMEEEKRRVKVRLFQCHQELQEARYFVFKIRFY